MPENNEASSEKIPQKKKGSFTSKDRHTCIALHSIGHTPIDIVYRYEPRYQMFYRFDNSALPDLKSYTLGEDLVVKIKDYEECEKRFRANLHVGAELAGAGKVNIDVPEEEENV